MPKSIVKRLEECLYDAQEYGHSACLAGDRRALLMWHTLVSTLHVAHLQATALASMRYLKDANTGKLYYLNNKR